jgi:ElaB/YqjD/DUF883 family membrane-anchored ribosome-binding protein
MATATAIPAFERIERNVRDARRWIEHGRHSAEDVTGAAVREIRSHPLRSIAIAAGTGVVIGAAVGALANRIARAVRACAD